jgi:chromosome segregation ATPase
MSENTTKGVGEPRSFEERLFARFDAMENRVDAGIANIGADLVRIRVDLDEVKTRLDGLETRVATIEENAGARFSLLELRLDKLEQTVDKRLLETRPIWEGVQFELRRINARLDQFVQEIFDLRADQSVLRKRVDALEGITT